MSKKLSKTIADNIKKYRTLNSLTQAQVAEMLNLDTQYYSQLERDVRSFTIETIGETCDLFHIGIEDVIELHTNKDMEKKDQEKLIADINEQLPALSIKQLTVLKKYISEILPFQK